MIPAWVSIAAPAFCAIALLMPLFLGRRRNYLEPVYIFSATYCYLYFLKPGMRIARGMDFIWGSENLLLACSLAAGGLLSFHVGYYAGISRHLVGLLPVMNQPCSWPRVRKVAWVSIALGSASLLTYMSASGGWREFWSKPHGYGGVAGFSSYISQATELTLTGFYLMYLESIAKRKWRLTLRLLLAAVPGVFVYSLLWSRRTNIIWIAIVVYVVFHLRRATRPTTRSFGILMLCIISSVVLALALRPHLHLKATADEFRNISYLDSFSNLSLPGDEFDSYLAAIALFPEQIDYDQFSLLLHLPLHPIPRSIWPDKPPLFTPSWDAFLSASGISWGASEGILGELFMQWGAGAVLFGMFVSGVLWRGFYDYLLRAPHAPFMQLFYAVALGNFASFIAQGSVSAITKWLPFILPSIVVSYWLCRVPARRVSLMFGRCPVPPRVESLLA